MRWWQKIIAISLVGLLDIVLGVFSAFVSTRIIGESFDVKSALFGIFSALWVDSDGVTALLTKRIKSAAWDHEHRDGLHYPLIVLSVCAVLAWLFIKPAYSAIFFLGTFFHFIHDSVGIGWGIKWLYPFSTKTYKFWGRKFGKFGFLISWGREELSSDAAQNGDANWLYNLYLRPSPILFAEIAIAVVLITLMVILY